MDVERPAFFDKRGDAAPAGEVQRHEWRGLNNRQSGPDEHSGGTPGPADPGCQRGQRCGLLNMQFLSRRPNRILRSEAIEKSRLAQSNLTDSRQ